MPGTMPGGCGEPFATSNRDSRIFRQTILFGAVRVSSISPGGIFNGRIYRTMVRFAELNRKGFGMVLHSDDNESHKGEHISSVLSAHTQLLKNTQAVRGMLKDIERILLGYESAARSTVDPIPWVHSNHVKDIASVLAPIVSANSRRGSNGLAGALLLHDLGVE